MSADKSAENQEADPLLGLGSTEVLGPLPETDVLAIGSLDIREDVEAYSPQAMEAERRRCYALGLAAGAQAAVEATSNDAERYRWHKARNPGALLANAWYASKAACEIGDEPDAATDVAMAEERAAGAA